MSFFSALIYMLISFLSGGVLIFLSLNELNSIYIEHLLIFVHSDPKLRILTALIGLWIILRCLNTIRNSAARKKREKTIAFESELGQVTISLAALEDTIKRLLADIKGLKEIKPQVTASKKEVKVILRMVLSSALNIPELTEKVQGIVRNKLQEMLGIEEQIKVQAEIRKIVFPEIKKVKEKGSDAVKEEDTTVPYRDF
jgi:uncharacterized alkaline shock family protein YloU